ncbi:hypothetical protein HUT06_00440 [Actinomadura sp. NAK00032]|uniref:hypothetical protein n=1 Tax=Actinomadura sp. NAK00032 TaxID=2742128 RepID=UPI0015926EA4|nr:hypothetical protein [Actinomadura sp. NAK00032]QKW32688.1 hypothetical protein HUT06_00440 [Actinomadura sp. NAK00032]
MRSSGGRRLVRVQLPHRATSRREGQRTRAISLWATAPALGVGLGHTSDEIAEYCIAGAPV